MITLTANQTTLVNDAFKDVFWEFDVTNTTPTTYNWSGRAFVDGATTYTGKIIKGSFEGIRLRRSSSEFGLIAPGETKFRVANASGALTASLFIGGSAVITYRLSNGTLTEDICSWAFNITDARTVDGELELTLETAISKALRGDYPNTALVETLFPSTNKPKPGTRDRGQSNLCVPVVFGDAYVPCHPAYISAATDVFYVLGPGSDVADYTVTGIHSPQEFPTAEWSTGFTFTKATKTDGIAYVVVQPLIGSSQDPALTTFKAAAGGDVEYLIVGGGGGGGGPCGANDMYGAGGGGAGGMLTGTDTIVAGSFAVAAGAGGAGGAGGFISTSGTDGGDSSFNGHTADGGGGGGRFRANGSSGGSGGGAGSNGAYTGGAGTVGQGNDGGGGNADLGTGGAGGGGAGAAGEDTPAQIDIYTNPGGDGGNGTASSITGSAVTYAGGGGGSSRGAVTPVGAGGTGGGGKGGFCKALGYGPTSGTAPDNGTDGLGGGGGGGGGTSAVEAFPGGDGGNGTVILKYLTSSSINGTGGTKTTSGLYTLHTFTPSVANTWYPGVWRDGDYLHPAPIAFSFADTAALVDFADVIEYVLEDFGVPSASIDTATTFAAAKTTHAGWGIEVNGGFFRKEPRQKIISDLLSACNSYLLAEDKIQLKVYSKTSVKTLDSSHVLSDSFRTSTISQEDTDSAYVSFQVASKPQDRFLKAKIPVKATSAKPASDTIENFFVQNTQYVQKAAQLEFQRRFLPSESVDFEAKYNTVALRPNDIITINHARFGGSYSVRVDEMQISETEGIDFKCSKFSQALDDWSNLSPGAITIATDARETDFTRTNYGPQTTPTSGTAPNEITGSVILGTNGAIYTSGKTSYSSDTAGVYVGWDEEESSYVMNLGSSTSYIKYDGSSVYIRISMDEGELPENNYFNVYGNLVIRESGDIYMESAPSSGDSSSIFFCDNALSIKWKIFAGVGGTEGRIIPIADNTESLLVGSDAAAAGRWKYLWMRGSNTVKMTCGSLTDFSQCYLTSVIGLLWSSKSPDAIRFQVDATNAAWTFAAVDIAASTVKFDPDNTITIGASGATRPKDCYLGGFIRPGGGYQSSDASAGATQTASLLDANGVTTRTLVFKNGILTSYS
jgi:hypothetical protein